MHGPLPKPRLNASGARSLILARRQGIQVNEGPAPEHFVPKMGTERLFNRPHFNREQFGFVVSLDIEHPVHDLFRVEPPPDHVHNMNLPGRVKSGDNDGCIRPAFLERNGGINRRVIPELPLGLPVVVLIRHRKDVFLPKIGHGLRYRIIEIFLRIPLWIAGIREVLADVNQSFLAELLRPKDVRKVVKIRMRTILNGFP